MPKGIVAVDIDDTIADWSQVIDPMLADPECLPVVHRSREVLWSWVNELGLDVVYVTFRLRIRKDMTLRWLHRNDYPNPDRVVFGDQFQFKTDVMREIDALCIIDDMEDVCLHAAQNGFRALCHRPTGVYPSGDQGNLWYVRSWDEIDKFVRGFVQESQMEPSDG